MMSPGRAQPKQSYQDVASMYRTPGGGIDMKSYEAHMANLERRKYQAMDPLEAIDAQQRDVASEGAVEGILADYPHLSPAQAQQMVASYQKIGNKPPRFGTPEYKLQDTVGRYYKRQGPERVKPRLPGPVDPGDRIRDLMPSKLEPYIKQCLSPTDCRMVPNPEWGKQNGMIWDGEAWVTDDPRKSSAHDLDMEMKRLEMERIRQQMELEKMLAEEELRAKRGSSGVAGGLRDWLNKRLGGG